MARLMRWVHWAVAIVIGLFVLIRVYPLVWLVISAMKDNASIFMQPWGLPKTITFEPFQTAWIQGHLGIYFTNSVIVSSFSVIGVLFVASLAAYAFARMEFPARQPLFYLFLLGLIIPIQSFVIPLYVLFRQIGLLNSLSGLIVAYVAWGLPIAIFVLHAFFTTLPKELEEAATIDGCNTFDTYLRVILPISKPALATIGIFTAISAWNELLLAMLFIRDASLKTLSAGLLLFQGHYDINYQMLFSGMTIVVLPLLVVYILFHRQIIEGLTVGAVKE